MKLWTLIFAGIAAIASSIAAIAAVTTVVLILKQFFENKHLERMKEQLYLSLQETGRINIAELIEAGKIQKKEASLALKACYALARDGVGEFLETDFYLKGRVPGTPYP